MAFFLYPLLTTWFGTVRSVLDKQLYNDTSEWIIEESSFEENNNSVKVGYVVANSPAEKSGIKVNDIIIKVGNKDIKKTADVISQISNNGINKPIKIVLKRGNKFIYLKVKPTDITNLQNK